MHGRKAERALHEPDRRWVRSTNRGTRGVGNALRLGLRPQPRSKRGGFLGPMREDGVEATHEPGSATGGTAIAVFTLQRFNAVNDSRPFPLTLPRQSF